MEDVNRRLQRVLSHIDLFEQELGGQAPDPEQRRELLRLHRLADELETQLQDAAGEGGPPAAPTALPRPPTPSPSSTAYSSAPERPRDTAQGAVGTDEDTERTPTDPPTTSSDDLSAKDTVFACLLTGAMVLGGGLATAYTVDDRNPELIAVIAAATLAPLLIGVGTYKGSVLRKRGTGSSAAVSPSERRWSLFGAIAAALVTNIVAMSVAPPWLL